MTTKYVGRIFEFEEDEQSDLLTEFLSMGKKYTSQFFESMIVTHQASAVRTAVVMKEQIRIEWDEDGDGGLAIDSNDGEIYSGTYGYKDPPQQHHCEFRRYQAANGDVLLFGKWQRFDDDPAEGYWVVQLIPQAKR